MSTISICKKCNGLQGFVYQVEMGSNQADVPAQATGFDPSKPLYMQALFCCCSPDEETPRPKHDGNLGDHARVEIREAFQDVCIHEGYGVLVLEPEQALSLRDWLIQESPVLEKFTKEQGSV